MGSEMISHGELHPQSSFVFGKAAQSQGGECIWSCADQGDPDGRDFPRGGRPRPLLVLRGDLFLIPTG